MFIDLSGEWRYSFAFDGEGGGVCPVKYNGYWGAIDTRGNVVVDFMFSDIYEGDEYPLMHFNDNSGGLYGYHFVNGLAAANLNGGTGIINANGEFVIPLSMSNGIFKIYDDIICEYNGGSKLLNIYDTNGNLLVGGFNYEETEKRKGNWGTTSTYTIYHSAKMVGKLGDRYVIEKTDDGAHSCFFFDPADNSLTEIEAAAGADLKIIEFGGKVYLRCSPVIENGEWDCRFIDALGAVVWEEYNRNGFIMSDRFIVGSDTAAKTITIWDDDLNQRYTLQGIETRYDSLRGRYDDFIGNSTSMFYTKNAVVNCETGEIFWFSKIAVGKDTVWTDRSSDINVSPSAIVYDEGGIFCGLWAGDKLAFNMEYTKITYDEKGDFYTLEKGASSFKVRVARDGTVMRL